MESQDIVEKIKKRKTLLFLSVFIVSMLAITLIINSVFNGSNNKYSILLLVFFLLSFFGLLISLFYLLQAVLKLVIKNKKIILLIVFVLLIGSVGFWYLYPLLFCKSDFEKYCRKESNEHYTCSFWDLPKDVSLDKRRKIIANIGSYCRSKGFKVNKRNRFMECYNFGDESKECSNSDDCNSGLCIPSNIFCEENCKGQCSEHPSCVEWSPIIHYLENGKVIEGGCPW